MPIIFCSEYLLRNFQDIPAENRSYMLRNLKPAGNYTVSVQMVNNLGFGPRKDVIVTTPREPEGKHN